MPDFQEALISGTKLLNTKPEYSAIQFMAGETPEIYHSNPGASLASLGPAPATQHQKKFAQLFIFQLSPLFLDHL